MHHRFLAALTACLAIVLVMLAIAVPSAHSATYSPSTFILAQRPDPTAPQDTRTDYQKGFDTGCNLGNEEEYFEENLIIYENTLKLASDKGLDDYQVGVIEGYESCRAQRESIPDAGTNCGKPPGRDRPAIIDCDELGPGDLIPAE